MDTVLPARNVRVVPGNRVGMVRVAVSSKGRV